ncbi:MAG: hypothetical protein QOK33_4016 [Mycobacterium sp.]|nr:hypothetical protein [Mycobacterium sp.]
MTLKTLVTGVAAAAVVSAAAVGVTSIASGASLASAPAVQPVVFGIPLPLDTPCGATADQLQSVLDRLAAPGGSFHGDKSDLVQGGIGILEGRTADRMLANAYQSGTLPVAFNVSPPVCGPGNSATATVTAAGRTQDVTFVPGGSSGWQVSRASATSFLAVMAG